MRPQPSDQIMPILLFTIIATVILISCGDNNKNHPEVPGYDIKKPFVYKLPQSLNEISGIVFYPKDTSLFAINDEEGYLYKIFLRTPLQIERWRFANGADYEDIALVDSTFYVLRSKGKLDKFKFMEGDSVLTTTYDIPASKKKELESMYYDSTRKRLIMICKECKGDANDQVTTWEFDPSTDNFESSFTISTKKMLELLNDKNEKEFKPSAAAIHPITGELYMIASVNRALAILDNKSYEMKAVYHISARTFKQPEGMTFTPHGDLIITNEAAESGTAQILFFKYHNSK